MNNSNAQPITCPNCHHERDPASPAPPGQCPRCGKEYAQFNVNAWKPDRGYSQASTFTPESSATARFGRLLNIALGVVVVMALMSWWFKGTGISKSDIDPILRKQPIQKDYTAETAPENFTFDYRGAHYEVQPVAAYEIWGLVMTHNDIDALGDSYHDENSVDTKDLCVIWGGNILTDSFNDVEFSSGSWTCYFSYPQGVSINHHELSNNHLVTTSQEIRDLIESVNIGDQIHIKGMLVNYRDARYNSWRQTSISRKDAGNKACEVVFVQEMRIISRGTPIWYGMFTASGILLLLIIVAKLGLFINQLRHQR